MKNVVIAGVGMHKCGRYPQKSYAEMALEACINALDHAMVSWRRVSALYAAHVQQGVSAGEAVVELLGQTGIPVYNVENACASGSTAIHQAYFAISQGLFDIVLVVGFEKMKKGVIGGTFDELNISEQLGLNVMPALYAKKANRHMKLYGTTPQQLAMVAVKNHKNGVLNPYAHYQKEVTIEEVLSSRLIADPLTLLQCCPTSDGAAAAVLCCEEAADQIGVGSKKVFVKGSSVLTSVYGHSEEELTRRAARVAYEMAGIEPRDVDLAEVHDAFTIGEILHYEALGFCPEGEGGRFVAEGRADINGDVAVNPSGGLQSRGHPLGMTGVAQVCEAVWQLRGEAGPRQVPNAQVALTHTQGFGGVCSVHVLTK